MRRTTAPDADEQDFILSSSPPSTAQKRLAVAVVFGLLAAYLIVVGPLADIPPYAIVAFVPPYATAMFVTDSITAILLFAEFSILRTRSTLVIASGYLFTALMLIPWMLSFPGVFAPSNLTGGPQSTVWLYCLWHTGFVICVIGYALSKQAEAGKRRQQAATHSAIALCVVLAVVATLGAAYLCTAGHALLPRVMLDSAHFGPLWPVAAMPVALPSIAAFVLLWRRRRSMLDLWLMVVMCLFLIETLNYYFDPVRFGLGLYAARLIGFIASSLVLACLLFEITNLYGRLLTTALAHRRERAARLMTGDAVAAAVAHEVRQPLTAMITNGDAGLRFLDRSKPDIDRAKEAFKRIVDDGHRAGEIVGSIRAIFKRDLKNRAVLDVNDLIREALSLVRSDLQTCRVVVEADLTNELPGVRGDLVQLRQVLLNLITNAMEAMTAVDEPRVLSVKSEAHEGEGVMVSVADTGPGINAQEINRIFNPLYTTKPDGMGMGLAICRSIVESHDGRLWVALNALRGTEFRFTLGTVESGSRSA